MAGEVEIVEVTQPVELAIVDDRLHATVISGSYRRTYALSFHKVRNAALAAIVLLDEHDRRAREKLRPIPRKRRPPAHS